MKPAFRLDQHPRRPQPSLSGPPAGYFEQLPRRVMARLPQPDAEATAGWHWLRALPAAWRTGLASSVLLAGFAASFWLSAPPGGPAGAAVPLAALDAVPETELVGYLLSPEVRVEPGDLAELTTANPALTDGVLRASDTELRSALDALPADEAEVL